MVHEGVTDKIINAFYRVYNCLGFGFLEKVYENALAFELPRYGFAVGQQQRIPVFYEGQMVGDYCADLVVEDLVIVELKAAESLRPEHFAQLTNYLRATDKEVGLLLNFGKKADFKRIYFSNSMKTGLGSGKE